MAWPPPSRFALQRTARRGDFMHRHAVLFAFGSYLGASTVAWAQPPGAAPEGPVIHPEFRDNRFDYDPFFYNQPNPVDPDDLDYEIEPLNRDDPLYSPWQGQRAYELDPYDASRYGFPPYPFYVPLPPEPEPEEPAPQPDPNQPNVR